MFVRKIYFIILIVVSFSIFSKTTFAQNIESIDSYDVQIDIKENGVVYVKETIKYYFPDYRHGIYRKIPLIKTNQDGKQFVLNVSNISVAGALDTPYPYEDQSSNTEVYLKIGDPNITVTGLQTYIIRYRVEGAMTYYSDHDELYWNITGNDWEVPINSVSVRINHPGDQNLSTVAARCFTGIQGNTDSYCSTSSKGNTVFISSTDLLYSGEGLTAVVSLPKNLIAVLEPEEFKKPLSETIIEYLVFFGAIVYYLIIPLIIIIFAYNKKKKQPEEKRVVAAWFDPPKTISGRPITSGEVGILYDRKGDIRDITSALIQLAEKGFLKIKTKEIGTFFKKQDFSMELLKDADDPELLEYESALLKAIFTNGNTDVNVNSLGKRTGFSSKIQNVYKLISESLHKDGFYETSPVKTRENWMFALFPAFFFFNPLLIIAALYASGSAKRTKAGAEAWATIESLKNFVKSQKNQLEFQAKNQMFFEKLLPYAIALGIERVWVERFKDLNLTSPEWLETNNFNSLSYLYMMDGFSSSFSSAVAISSSRSSSGFSSGFSGGFSGGGGGGGGGGSW